MLNLLASNAPALSVQDTAQSHLGYITLASINSVITHVQSNKMTHAESPI
jgi:hypothetical protein